MSTNLDSILISDGGIRYNLLVTIKSSISMISENCLNVQSPKWDKPIANWNRYSENPRSNLIQKRMVKQLNWFKTSKFFLSKIKKNGESSLGLFIFAYFVQVIKRSDFRSFLFHFLIFVGHLKSICCSSRFLRSSEPSQRPIRFC